MKRLISAGLRNGGPDDLFCLVTLRPTVKPCLQSKERVCLIQAAVFPTEGCDAPAAHCKQQCDAIPPGCRGASALESPIWDFEIAAYLTRGRAGARAQRRKRSLMPGPRRKNADPAIRRIGAHFVSFSFRVLRLRDSRKHFLNRRAAARPARRARADPIWRRFERAIRATGPAGLAILQ
jgi:hypothetical protein